MKLRLPRFPRQPQALPETLRRKLSQCTPQRSFSGRSMLEIRDIEIHAHLDLRPLPLITSADDIDADTISQYGIIDYTDDISGRQFQLGHVRSSTRSIRVRFQSILH